MRILKRILLVILACILIAAGIAAVALKIKDTEKYTLDDGHRKQAPGSFIGLSDGLTHFELAGPDSAKLIVLVHGFSVPFYIWDSTFNYLVAQGYRVLRYDEFGRGYSDRPDKVYSAAFLRKQLHELLDSLHVKQVEALAGLSFGGPVTTDFMAHYPGWVNKLILVDPAYPDAGPAKFTYPEFVQEYMMALNPEKMVAGQLTDLKYPERFPAWGDQYKVQMQFKGFRQGLVSTRNHYAEPDSVRANYAKVESLHKPVLLIWGREDETVPFRYADSVRKVLSVDYFPVNDAGHLPQMEKAALVNEKINTFLKN